MRKIFEYESYKDYLRDWVTQGHGKIGDLARGAGCHRTYLSQVLHSKPELTTDHAVNLCDFFQFDAFESVYFLTCHLYERARLTSSKETLRRKLAILREKANQVSKRVQSSTRAELIDPDELGAYYSDPHFSLIHLATSCESTQTVLAISEKFGLPSSKVKSMLEYLVSVGLVTQSGALFTHSGKSIHLKKRSAFTRMNHLNWRLVATEGSTQPESIHFTNVFSVSTRDAALLRESLLQFIETQSQQIAQSGTEEVMVFCCDLFSPQVHPTRIFNKI